MKEVDVRQSGTKHTLYVAQPILLRGRSGAQVLACPPLVAAACQLGLEQGQSSRGCAGAVVAA